MTLPLYLACFLTLISTAVFAQNATPNTVNQYAPETTDALSALETADLKLNARLIEKGSTIERGMVWRVYQETDTDKQALPLIATAEGGSALLTLPLGTYLVHASFGRAGATQRIVLDNSGASRSFVLQAGGLQLNAHALDQEIPAKDLYFSIYEQKIDENGERKLIALNASANKVIQLNEGTYHVLSRYGKVNATVRADLQVTAGKITKALLQHRGAGVSLRLVSEKGGSPVANTSWTILTEDGEEVFSSSSIAPSLILAEGTYEANGKNGDRNFKKSFKVKTGQNIRLEVLIQ